MVNSVYGKTMENLMKRVNVKLVNNEKDYVKYVSRPTFVSQKILDKNLVAIYKVKPVLLLNKSIYDNSNKKVIGKMKDEMSSKVISEIVGLKSKMYSLVTVDDEEKVRAKGINKKLRHDEFYDVLFDKKVIRHNMKRIQAKEHRLGTYDICKVSLSCFDDKRYLLNDGVKSLAYGHKDIV